MSASEQNERNERKTSVRKANRGLQGKNFRWVVPRLSPDVWERKEAYKAELLDRLLESKTARKGVRCYSLAIESHADGAPHLDLLLIFDRRVRLSCVELDTLCGKHGDLTRYRTLNHAILSYGSKEDTPLTNMPEIDLLLMEQDLKRDPYPFFQAQMLKDPFRFDLAEYCADKDLFRHVRNFTSVNSKLKVHQAAVCNQHLRRKPGILRITRELIQRELTPSEREEYYSWEGYQTIVNYVNSVWHHGYSRPFKSRQLLLVGAPNTGKTTLTRRLSEFYATYEVGLTKWFPEYKDGCYKLFSWNEFSLNIMPYTMFLKLLEGTYTNLEQKGGSVLRTDNQLIVMNSNLTLFQHLNSKFGTPTKIDYLPIALQNSRARIHQVVIPRGRTLFLLLKLIKPNPA